MSKAYIVEPMSLRQRVAAAKRLTATYARTHKGRGAKQKECIKRGYLVQNGCVCALAFNTVTRRGELLPL